MSEVWWGGSDRNRESAIDQHAICMAEIVEFISNMKARYPNLDFGSMEGFTPDYYLNLIEFIWDMLQSGLWRIQADRKLTDHLFFVEYFHEPTTDFSAFTIGIANVIPQ